MLTQFYIAGFTDGVPHIWDHIGITGSWLQKNNFGRVAVEMKLSILQPARVGAVLKLVSRSPRVGEKTITLVHQVVDMETGSVYATGEVVGLIMDLEGRKALPIPEFARN